MLCGLSFYKMISTKSLLLVFFVLINLIEPKITFAQNGDSLQVLIATMQRGENDSIRTVANTEFQQRFLDSLNSDGSFDKSFSEFKNISIAKSEDNSFKIYTWTYPTYNGDKYFYFGYVQLKLEKSDSILFFPLSDSTSVIIKPEAEKLKADRWFGAVYYAINKVKYKGENFYVLLGWKGFNQQITKKVIEVCYLEKGVLKFGFPLFKSGSIYRNRLLYSFAAQATMSLRFDNNGKKIILDHISAPKSKQDVDLSSQSGPDGTYDSFNLKNGRYFLNKDVDARSETAPTKDLPVPPEK